MSGGDREQIASGWQFAGRTAMPTGVASGEEGDGPEHRGAKETPGMRRMVERRSVQRGSLPQHWDAIMRDDSTSTNR